LGGLEFGYFPAGNCVLSILKQNLLVGVSGKVALTHLFQNSGPVEEGCLIFWLQTETLIEVVKGHLEIPNVFAMGVKPTKYIVDDRLILHYLQSLLADFQGFEVDIFVVT
jgi:hypothetical protein